MGRTQTFDWKNDWAGRGGHDTPKNEAEEGKRRLHDRRKSWHTQNDGSEVRDMTKTLFEKHILWVEEEIMMRNVDGEGEGGDQGDLTGMFGFLAAGRATLIT